jgi:hypothetical protein
MMPSVHTLRRALATAKPSAAAAVASSVRVGAHNTHYTPYTPNAHSPACAMPCGGSSRALHTRLEGELGMLSAFPEWASSAALRRGGRLQQATGEMQRVFSALSSCRAPGPVSAACAMRLAGLCVEQGDLTAAQEKLTAVAGEGAGEAATAPDDVLSAACVLQARALVQLLGGAETGTGTGTGTGTETGAGTGTGAEGLAGVDRLLQDCDALLQQGAEQGAEQAPASLAWREEIESYSHGLRSVLRAYGGDLGGAGAAAALSLDTARGEHNKLLAANNVGAVACLRLSAPAALAEGGWAPLSSSCQSLPAGRGEGQGQGPGGALSAACEAALQEGLAAWGAALTPFLTDLIQVGGCYCF